MPIRLHKTPVPRLHKPSGQARIRFNGAEVYLGPWGSKKAKDAYARFLEELAATRAAGPTMEPSKPLTVSVAVLQFRAWADKRYRHPDGRPTREAENFKYALKPLRAMYGTMALAELGPGKIYQLQAHLVAEGLSRRTINSRVGKIRRFVRWCVGREMAPPSLITALAAVEPLREGQGGKETPRRRPVSWETVEKTLPCLPEVLQALVKALWFTGARLGELLPLTTGMIEQAHGVHLVRLSKHKNAWRGQDRVIVFGPEAMEAIRPLLRPFSPDVPIFNPRLGGKGSMNRTGPKAPGSTYNRHSIPTAIRRAAAAAGVEPWACAQLRHAAATRIRERFGIDVAAAILGHAKPTMTAHYSRQALAHAVEAAREAG